MPRLHKLIDSEFEQPLEQPYSRKVSGLEEDVNYLQGSHVRIWCNTDIVTYETHYHSAFEIIYMCDGDAIVRTSDRDSILKAGDIVFISPYITHQVKFTRPSKQFILMIDVSTLSDFNLENIIKIPANSIPIFRQEDSLYESVANPIIDMINSYFTYEPFWELSVFASFLNLTVEFSKAYTAAQSPGSVKEASMPSPSNNKEHYYKFTELMQYIDDNFAEPLTLDFISSHVGFSKYHFIRLFKEYTGSTFYDYLTNKRIQHAQYLLSSDMGITDIAFSCGFNNQTSFCRSFKNIVGCPPTEYRQKLRNETI